MSVLQLSLSHVDGALVVWHHHRDEVVVDVARGLHGHVGHHLVHRRIRSTHERSITARRGFLRRSCRRCVMSCIRHPGRRSGFADRKPHCRDLLQLLDHNLLRNAKKFLIMAELQLGLGHVDGALMMRHHHRDKIAIRVARGLHGHARHHLVHRGFIQREERTLGIGRNGSGRDARQSTDAKANGQQQTAWFNWKAHLHLHRYRLQRGSQWEDNVLG